MRFGRGQKAMALVPLAVLSAAWTASIATTGAGTALADSSSGGTGTTLPDGTDLPSQAVEAPASVSAAGGLAPGIAGNAKQVVATASTSGIPAAALAAYQRAETVINSADPACKLSWQLVAAIGRVESDHGRTGGNTLDSNGVAQPGIFGPPLNGRDGTTRISDTDAGQYDSDSKWDRAVGPMQFIPSTWSVVGVDADGDGQRNPQDINDAALATAVYLCSGDEDLSTTAGQRAAVMRYNHSKSYVELVLSIMNAYLDGEFTSVPNGVTSAGYVVPVTPASGNQGGKHQGGKQHGAQGPKGGGSGTPGGTGTGTAPGSSPTKPPSTPAKPTPSTPPVPTPTGPKLPLPSLPPLPSTSVPPVDQVLTVAQATVQCTADGYLLGTPAFTNCVNAYTGKK